MKPKCYGLYNEASHCDEDTDDIFLSVRDIANMHGLNFETLMARLNMDCQLPIAVQMPEDWLLLSVTKDKNGDAIFHIAERTYRCNGEVLLSYIQGRTE